MQHTLTTVHSPEFIKALDAFFRYAVNLNYLSEGKTFVKMKLEEDGSGMVLDMDRGAIHFTFQNATDLHIKSSVALIELDDPEDDTAPRLTYRIRENDFFCYENVNLDIPYAHFREAVETVLRDQNCSVRTAVEHAMQWRYWRLEEGKPTFLFDGPHQ